MGIYTRADVKSEPFEGLQQEARVLSPDKRKFATQSEKDYYCW